MTAFAFHSPGWGCWVLIRSPGRHLPCKISEAGYLMQLDKTGRLLSIEVEHEETPVLVDFDLLEELQACSDQPERFCLLADHCRYAFTAAQCQALADDPNLLPLLLVI